MIERTHGDLRFLQFETLSAEAGLTQAFTTRPQNYAPHRGRERDDAVHWRRAVCAVLGVPFDALTSPQQVHGAEVVPVEDQDTGCGRDGRSSALRFVDGLITDRPDVPLILLSADCPLVCVYDRERPAVGAVHASWQGTVAGASTNLVRQMQRAYGSDPATLLAAISPSAGPCCYEVGHEVRRILRTRMDDADQYFVAHGDRLYLDLWQANRWQLTEAGVPDAQIEVAGACSICDDRFWSHRRDGPDAGRSALFIGLRARVA